MKVTFIRQCCECRDGEHDNYDDDIRFVTARDPETGKMAVHGYVCAEHRQAFADDGYIVKETTPC